MDQPTTEIWKDIDGFDDYEVSNLGRVRNRKTDHILKASGFSNRVTLCVDWAVQEKYSRMVSRLVAEAFLEDYSEEYEVHHRSIDRGDNSVANIYMSNHKVRGNSRKKNVKT